MLGKASLKCWRVRCGKIVSTCCFMLYYIYNNCYKNCSNNNNYIHVPSSLLKEGKQDLEYKWNVVGKLLSKTRGDSKGGAQEAGSMLSSICYAFFSMLCTVAVSKLFLLLHILRFSVCTHFTRCFSIPLFSGNCLLG